MSILLLTGCGKSDTTRKIDSPQNDGKKKIAIIVKGMENIFYQSVKAGADVAAKETGMGYYFTSSPAGEADINGQIDLVEKAIKQNVSGIVIAASDAKALVPVVEKAIAAGIPVVVVDSGLETDKYVSFLATDNIVATAAVAKAMAESLNEKGTVALVNFVAGAQGAIEREKGFRDTMAKYPDIKILPTQYYDNDKQKAFVLAQDILASNPDLDGIFACNEPGTVSVARALKEANNKKVIEYGFDSSDDIVLLIKEGYLKATVVQMPYNMGYLGVKTLADKINGKEVEKNKDTGFTLVTTENIDRPDIQKILYPLGKK